MMLWIFFSLSIVVNVAAVFVIVRLVRRLLEHDTFVNSIYDEVIASAVFLKKISSRIAYEVSPDVTTALGVLRTLAQRMEHVADQVRKSGARSVIAGTPVEKQQRPVVV